MAENLRARLNPEDRRAAETLHLAFFRLPYEGWRPIARVLARVNAWLACAILYYLVLTPYAVLARMLGARFLRTGPERRDTYWTVVPPRDPVESTRRTF